MSQRSTFADVAKAWPFQQARLVAERLKRSRKEGPAIFETGYGPSGPPHVGILGEIVRTAMICHAFRVLTGGDIPTRLVVFSDDMAGLREAPANALPADAIAASLHRPLAQIEDQYGCHASLAQHNNARLVAVLDQFDFDYEFLSAAECYKSGKFDETLLRLLRGYDQVMAIMLPTLREERRATYSPFLPISPKTGRVLEVPTLAIDLAKGSIWFEDEDGERVETSVTGGNVKARWKPDWALRWTALGVDHAMSAKVLGDSLEQSGKICRVLGGSPPEALCYELFLDAHGEKISKTAGNGLAIEDWLRYGPTESLSLYLYQKPKTAKRLYFDVIPKAVDEYLAHIDAYPKQSAAERMENPVWHMHNGAPPAPEMAASYQANASVAPSSITFALLLNLVAAANAESKEQLWRFIAKYAPGASPETHPMLDRFCGYAIAYYDDFVKPTKRFRAATDKEGAAFEDLIARLDALPADITDAEAIQNEVYAVGKDHAFEPLRDWFKALYEVLFGQEAGPRFGSFAAIFGVRETAALLRRGLAGELAA